MKMRNNSSGEKVQYSSDKFVICFPQKEEFAINHNRFYTIVCRTIKVS